ncbi:hypothetical protein PRIPAC_74770 [Pristionchus pacificus]|uniref:Uncharacterized protein n=1 Tax=Pristionchus pacificus TaxID=54126 RepID=A0A2A6BFV8_PRIPA|nr:hypothetical protein PRIPAC_74770 [Pristionchus pacificus]|eukprot:PDM64738.1 hypothetical protein PRIPAC_52994 [Pristionchus pacificus]
MRDRGRDGNGRREEMDRRREGWLGVGYVAEPLDKPASVQDSSLPQVTYRTQGGTGVYRTLPSVKCSAARRIVGHDHRHIELDLSCLCYAFSCARSKELRGLPKAAELPG